MSISSDCYYIANCILIAVSTISLWASSSAWYRYEKILSENIFLSISISLRVFLLSIRDFSYPILRDIFSSHPILTSLKPNSNKTRGSRTSLNAYAAAPSTSCYLLFASPTVSLFQKLNRMLTILFYSQI